jgi:predicted methyltransferase
VQIFSTRSFSLLLTAVLALSSSLAWATEPDLATRLSTGDRAEADKARDAGRRPAAIIEFLGIEPGMTVMDLIAASGYYTEVLSEAVGPEGRVYAQNPEFVLKYRDGANDKAMTARLAGGRLPNVERLDRGLDDLGLAPDSLDAVITALNFHDIYNGSGPEAANAMLTAVRNVLRPGGVLGLIEHSGNADTDNEKLHRLEESKAVAAAKKAGFVVEATSDLLRHPKDDRTKMVFAEGLRGATDRFVLKLRKPR